MVSHLRRTFDTNSATRRVPDPPFPRDPRSRGKGERRRRMLRPRRHRRRHHHRAPFFRAAAAHVVVFASLLYSPTAAGDAALDGGMANRENDDDGERRRRLLLLLPVEWEDGPSSWDEFGHDNDPDVCGLRAMTAKEWESGRYWEGKEPVLVTGVTDGWPARTNWKK